MVTRLLSPLADENVELSVAKTGAQTHPVICVARKRLLANLAAFLDKGGRKVDAWQATLNMREVAFDDQPDSFRNLNSSEDLRAIARESRS
jgi:molybdopterin-guanine dinucleotide biosynthesis protein A